MKLAVTGCKDCPFLIENDRPPIENIGMFCSVLETGSNHRFNPDFKIEEDENFDPVTPNFCPLKKEPITIHLP